MNIIFLTRCYKPNNIQTLKDNLKDVFCNQTAHSYVQYLIVDMSYGQKQQTFNQFVDEHTKVYFVYNKKDYYNSWGMDQLIKRIRDDQNSWVYILDDDNTINKNFLKVFDNYQNEDVFVINWNRPKPAIGKIIGFIDASNYIVKLKARKETPMYIEDKKSYQCDGRLFQNLVKKQYNIKYTTGPNVMKYSALERPLNVLRKDL